MAGRGGRKPNPNLLYAPRNDDAGSGADRCGARARPGRPGGPIAGHMGPETIAGEPDILGITVVGL